MAEAKYPDESTTAVASAQARAGAQAGARARSNLDGNTHATPAVLATLAVAHFGCALADSAP